MRTKRRVSLRTGLVLLAIVLLLGCIAGGTLAFLTAKTSTVSNTFVIGDIGTLKLYENGAEITADTENTFEVIPGADIDKAVKLNYSYTAQDGYDDVPVYIFVKVGAEEWTVSNNTEYSIGGDLMTWSIAAGWDYLKDEADGKVYYCAVAEDSAAVELDVIAGGKITVSDKIDKNNIATVAAAGDIDFTAYVIQQGSFADAEAAWAAAIA